MKTISFAIQKGGTGKTSISVSVAIELARAGKKVLFIDSDPQGNASDDLKVESLSYELGDILNAIIQNQPIDFNKAVIKTSEPNLSIIASAGVGGNLSSIKDVIANTPPYSFLDKVITPLSDYFDYCIIDTPPSFTALEKYIFIASDEVIPVILLDNFSKSGIELFINNLQNLKESYHLQKPYFSKIVLNQLNRTKKLEKMYLEAYQKNFTKFFVSVIPTEPNFPKSQELKIPVQDLQKTKEETISSIKALTEEILKDNAK